MGAAQGQYRGPQQDDERQYAGGDAAAQAATSEQARRAVAFKTYRDGLAHLNVHEVWEGGRLVGYRPANPDRQGKRPLFPSESLAAERFAALGY